MNQNYRRPPRAPRLKKPVVKLDPQSSREKRQVLLQPEVDFVLDETNGDPAPFIDAAIRNLNARPLSDGTYVFQGMSGRWWNLTRKEMVITGWTRGVGPAGVPIFSGVIPLRMPLGWKPRPKGLRELTSWLRKSHRKDTLSEKADESTTQRAW